MSERAVTADDRGFLLQVYAESRRDELGCLGWSPEQIAQFIELQFGVQQRAYALQFPRAEQRILLCDGEPAGQWRVQRGEQDIVLVDIAYYLIFVAFILFTMTIELPSNWDEDVNAAQVKTELARVGGILLIIGLLHAANVVMLPVMGRLLTSNRRLDEAMDPPAAAPIPMHDAPAGPAVPMGSWVLRIEPAPPPSPAPPPPPAAAPPPVVDEPG